MAANTSASIDLLVTGRSAIDRLIGRVSKLDEIVNRLNSSPLDISRSTAARDVEKLQSSMTALARISEDAGKGIAGAGAEIQKNYDKISKAQDRLSKLKNPETKTYKKLQQDIIDAAAAIDALNDKTDQLTKRQRDAQTGAIRLGRSLSLATKNQASVAALQNLADEYLRIGDIRKKLVTGGFGKEIGLDTSINQLKEQASALSLVANNVKIASADFNRFSVAVEGANKKLAEAEQQRFKAIAFGLSPQAQRQNFGTGNTEANLAGSRKLIASALAMGDTVTRSEAAMDSYLGYLERLRSLVPVISNEYRALEERIASVREEMSGFGLRGQAMKIQPQLGPASRLDDPKSIIKKQGYYEKIELQLDRIAALETRVDQAFLSQNQKLELRQKLDKATSSLAERDLAASKRQTAEIDRQRMSLERLNRRGAPTPVTEAQKLAAKAIGWRSALAQMEEISGGAPARSGAGQAGRIKPSNIRTTDVSPIDAPKRLGNILASGLLLQEKLAGAQAKGIEIGDTLVKLQNTLNAAKADTFEISAKSLDALDEELNRTRQLLALEKQRAANAQAESKASEQLAKRLGRGQQRDTGTLTSILGSLGRADTAAKVFRGGRSGEQALSNIIGAFNASTAPPKASPLAPGPTAPRYTGPDAGREMEIDRYRGIFAGLTNNPRFYNRLLQGLPREAITTTMAGRASDISKAVEDAKRPDRKALESSIRLAYEEAVGNIPSAVTELFDKIGSVFDSIVNRVKGGTGGVGGAGGGGGGKPPLPPAAGGPEPQDFAGRVDTARGSADKLLGLKDLADMSGASIKQLQLLSQALSETREGVKMTDKSFDQLTKVLNKVDDQIARRDPNADFLTRRFGRRSGQAVGEGLIGGAFPLLFGQGAGAAAGGGLGGFLGGMAGGTLGFGLSLAGTAIGSQVDALMQATQDTGNMLRDLVGNFEQIKESGLLASRSQEKLIGNQLEAGNKTAAYAIIQDELNRKLGVDGAAKLREAADAGDRLKRAMADLGVQIQLLVAGPLTDILNSIAKGLEGRNKISSVGDTFNKVPASKQKELLDALASANIQAGASPASNRVLFTNTPFGGISTNPNGGGSESRGDLFRRLTSNLNQQQIQGVFDKFLPTATARPETDQQQRDRAIRDAGTRQAAAQRQLEVFNKRNEGVDILKGFKQQANAVRREQEDINRQSFELRRDYERQIEDIRRGVEDKISQLRQENAQKELEILVKQGQIREQQFKNAATTLQGTLAGDPLAQSLADAVTTYLGAQLSAQNEIEQRRKQFEIEINNQQVELEKYKLDVARTISRLNTDTAEKVAQINLGIARRNEDAALNSFATEKQTAKLRFQLLAAELRVLEAKELNTAAQASAEAQRNPLMLPEYTAQFDAATSNATRLATAADNIVKNLIPQLEQIAPPPRLGEIAPVATRGVSLAGVNAQKARGDQLRAQFQAFSDELTGLVETGNFAEFTNRISEIGRGGFDELSNNLDTARKELALVGGDFGPIAQGITDAYQKVIDDLPRLTAKLTPELQAQVPALKQYLEASRQSQIQLEKLRPTLEFYITGYGDLKSQTEQAKNSISELLSPTKNYDRILQDINKRGGLGINEEYNRRILQAAKNLDNLNAKLKALNALRDVASGFTDTFIEFGRELLTNTFRTNKYAESLENVLSASSTKLSEKTKKELKDAARELDRSDFSSVTEKFAKGIADKTIGVVLEFTLRPLEEQLFKNLTNFLGIEAPQDPTLLPIKETAQNTKDLVDLQKRQFAGQTGIKPPEPANNIVSGPGSAMQSGMTPINQAWLDTIAFAEGTWDAVNKTRRYNIGFGHNQFDNTKPHPGIVWSAGGRRSAASGAYQFMPDTWRMVNQGQNPPMLPGTQDAAALSLIQRRGADPNAMISRQAVSKLASEWASFPTAGGGSYYGQPFIDYPTLEKFFKERLNIYGNQSSPVQPAPTPGPQGSARPPIGDQFVSQILGGRFEDVAGLQPLPLQRMYRQMGRQVRRWTDMIQNEARYILKRDFGTDKPLIPQDIIDKTVDRVRTLTNTIQGFDPLELQFRELENRARGSSGQARSQPSSISLTAFGDIFSKIERRVIIDAANSLNQAGGYLSELGRNADLSDFLPENTKKFLADGIRQIVSNDEGGFKRKALEQTFSRNFSSFFQGTIDLVDFERNRSVPTRGAAGGRDSLSLPEIQRTPSGGIDYLRQYRELQELMEPPRITPGVENQFEGAALPIGDQFMAMLAGSKFSNLASAGRLFADRPGGPRAYPLPAGYPYPPGQGPAATQQLTPTTAPITEATKPIVELGVQAKTTADGVKDLGTEMSDSVTKFQKTVGIGLQAISSIAMGIGGAQMIRKGGAYNTLMGAASIFGSISSITGMFGTGGSLSDLFGRKPKPSLPGFTGEMLNLGNLGLPGYASGGRPDPYDPAIIGENGPELWVPDRPGTIIPNDELYVPGLDDKGGSAPSIGRYARRAASSMESGDGESGDTIYTGNYGRAVPYQRSETTREIDRLERITTNPKELPPIKYETTRVNEYDFVTPEQLEASNARTAKIARNQTIRELADSMKTRKRLGL